MIAQPDPVDVDYLNRWKDTKDLTCPDVRAIVAAEFRRWEGPISDGHDYELSEAITRRINELDPHNTEED